MVKMIPPLPTGEASDELTMFVAITFAYTLTPQGRLNGVARRTEMGIVQLVAVMIGVVEPSQLLEELKFTPSL